MISGSPLRRASKKRDCVRQIALGGDQEVGKPLNRRLQSGHLVGVAQAGQPWADILRARFEMARNRNGQGHDAIMPR